MARQPITIGNDRFIVTFDGPAVAEGHMNAGALGGSMVSLARLIEASAALTLGANVAVQTEIVADFRGGSFSFEVLAGIPDFSAVVIHLLRSMEMKDVLTTLGITGSGGLVGFIMWLRRSKVVSATPVAGDRTKVTTNDERTTVINTGTMILFQNSSVRASLDGLVAPLRRQGVTELRTGRPGEPAVVIPADAVDFFDAPITPGEELQDKVSIEIVQLDGVSLVARRKWRFLTADGSSFTSAPDPHFLEQVRRREIVFGHGDALEVELRTVVTRSGSGELHVNREIIRVIRPIPAPRPQLPLDFEEPPSHDPDSLD